MKKYIKGQPITSLDELASQEHVFHVDELYTKDEVISWKLKVAIGCIEIGSLYKAIEHKKTILEDFLEKHPSATLDEDGLPRVCAGDVGYTSNHYTVPLCDEKSCKQCWNQPLCEKEGKQ